MGAPAVSGNAAPMDPHPPGYRARRALNWFPLGLTYALLYMGRYNLTVAKTSLGDLMTKEDFGVIFGAGTFVYALAFLINGPLVDRFGGRRGMLIAAIGSMLANAAMGFYLQHVLASANTADAPLRLVFSVLYAANMYFQSFAAVSIVKVNSHWFHVSERGSFSGIFGTMISSGIFLAFTVNGWLLSTAADVWEGRPSQWIVFLAPSLLLGVMAVVEFFLLRDSPGKAGFAEFDTGDASSGEENEPPLPTAEVFKRLLTNPVILTVAAIEFCTGVLRNGVMHWFPIYASEVWVLPQNHVFMRGSWDSKALLVVCFAVAAISGFLAKRAKGGRRGGYAIAASLAFLAPFFQGGWGGLLFIAGVIGGNVAGWVSDLFFQSRRGPAAAGLYFFLAACTIGMVFTLAPPTNEVASASSNSGLQAGDRIVAVAGNNVSGWAEIRTAVACVPAQCRDSGWDAAACTCVSGKTSDVAASGVIDARIVRDGNEMGVQLPDPTPVMRAGDKRKLAAQPVLPISPWWMGSLVFLLSLSVIGVHGLLSGTATMDFGGRRAAATATGVIDGFVYLGTAVQSLALGFLTSQSWTWWPVFLVPFAIAGALLSLKIWNAKPKSARKSDAQTAAARKAA